MLSQPYERCFLVGQQGSKSSGDPFGTTGPKVHDVNDGFYNYPFGGWNSHSDFPGASQHQRSSSSRRPQQNGQKPFYSNSSNQSNNQQTKKQDTAIEHDLPVSLEEVLKGSVKKMKINRKALHADGRSYREDKVLTIYVKPGWKAGTKITFPREGDQSLNTIAADIVFIIKDKPHDKFKRDGSNIKYIHKISLKDALTCDTHVQVPTLQGETINLPIYEIIKPDTVKKIPQRGLPHTKDKNDFGDLLVSFDIQFPDMLSQESRKLVARALP